MCSYLMWTPKLASNEPAMELDESFAATKLMQE